MVQSQTLIQFSLFYHSTKGRKHVSLHDAYNPSFWTDGFMQNLRKTANLPDWMANEEGQVVIDWMPHHNMI